MGIPYNKWSCDSKNKQYFRFDNPLPNQRFSEVFDIKTGPVNLSDSQGNLAAKFWMVYQETNDVKLVSAVDETTWSEPILIFTETFIIEDISLTFDQLGREIIFYKTSEGLILWYYDSIDGMFIKKTIATEGKTPIANFDLIFDTSDPDSDALIFYVKNDGIYWRVQRERFDIEYFSYEEKEDIELYNSGITTGLRFKLDYKYPNFKDRRELPKAYETDSAVFTSLNDDVLEIGFTLGFGEYKHCSFIRGVTSFGLIEQTDWSSLFGVNLKIRCSYVTDEEYPQVWIEARTPGEIIATLQMNDHFRRGDYKFVFTNESPSVKKIEMFFNNVLVDSQTFNKPSEEPVTDNTKLKFASLDEHTTPSRLYWSSFPAQFFNMYAIVNGNRIDWPVTEGVQGAISVPAGNNLNLIKPSKDIKFLS